MTIIHWTAPWPSDFKFQIRDWSFSGGIATVKKLLYFVSLKQEDTRKKWVEIVPQKKRKLRESDYVCEKHFNSEDIIVMRNAFSEVTRKKLKPEAVPSKFKLDDSGNFHNVDDNEKMFKPAETVHNVLDFCKEDDSEKMLEATATVNDIQNFSNEDKENMLRGASGIPENSLNVC